MLRSFHKNSGYSSSFHEYEESAKNLQKMISGLTKLSSFKVHNKQDWNIWRNVVAKYMKRLEFVEFHFDSSFEDCRSQTIAEASVIGDQMIVNQIMRLNFKDKPWI